ncbi:DUF4136 domain-containing protein [Roseateles koreensis]|uniref:DUF4136 domain-containing protein n=1 Tax=Roseateles koreensis TaxID=2987526 RepID=A0ABT5KPE4_9BURK|nr:DUF4136 domain-containing protein [Roseateles koreensis]MDC8784781.1 DUF4136 domain-containing protein [Roseateles koreensis]
MNRRRLFTASLVGWAAVAVLGLSACNGIYTVSSEVSTYGNWTPERKPGSYAFDRLPSQQMPGDAAEVQTRMEEGARAAMAKAGFTETPDTQAADYLVTLGVRVNASDRAPWDDPLWWRWHGNYTAWRYGFGYGYALGPRRGGIPFPGDPLMDRRFDRAVAVLVRDRKTAEPLYEARASNEGVSPGDRALIGAMFDAAMSDFPQVDPKPRRVTVQVNTQAQVQAPAQAPVPAPASAPH